MSSTAPLLRPGYETRDASPWLIGVMGGLVAGLLVAVFAASAWIYHARYAHLPTARRESPEASFRDGAAWQSGIARDWAEEDRRVRTNLATYGWIDRRAGAVRIPIERAMNLLSQEGRP